MKLVFKFAVMAAIFIGLWQLLSRYPFVEKLGIRKFTEKKQVQLGNLMLKAHRSERQEVTDTAIVNPLKELRNRLCLANGIDTAKVHVYLFRDEEINAFAIPGGNIIINSGLVGYCENADMLAGVMAHEIGHVQMDHVSKKLIKEIGLSAVIMLAGGDVNNSIMEKIFHSLTSSKFDREQEKEADALSVRYLQQAQGDPYQMALFFRKLSQQTDAPEFLDWISTHPGLEERAVAIEKTFIQLPGSRVPLLTLVQWNALKKADK
ncbi:MAG: M48 family metallopeptidase [Sphingobacteriales bacterium]|nr:MAG: M48 family metallopeptidase [Sphingobacteriales bacterium]